MLHQMKSTVPASFLPASPTRAERNCYLENISVKFLHLPLAAPGTSGTPYTAGSDGAKQGACSPWFTRKCSSMKSYFGNESWKRVTNIPKIGINNIDNCETWLYASAVLCHVQLITVSVTCVSLILTSLKLLATTGRVLQWKTIGTIHTRWLQNSDEIWPPPPVCIRPQISLQAVVAL